MPTTARGAFPYPAGADNWKMVRAAIQALADRAAAATVLWRQTTAAARGNAGAAGTLHHSSDTGDVSLDTGTSWLGLLAKVGDQIMNGGLTTNGLSSGRGVYATGYVSNAPVNGNVVIQVVSGQTSSALTVRNTAGTAVASVTASGMIAGHHHASTTATAGTSGAAPLPATPQGYMHFWDQDNQRVMKVPYYLP